MSGIYCAMFNPAPIAVGPANPIPDINLEDYTSGGGTASASVTIYTNGTISVIGLSSYVGSLGNTSGNWYNPTTTGIGTTPGYWVRMTKNSGVNNTSGAALGSWLALTANQTWTWAVSTISAKIANVKIEISSSASGTPIVGTRDNINVDVERYI